MLASCVSPEGNPGLGASADRCALWSFAAPSIRGCQLKVIPAVGEGEGELSKAVPGRRVGGPAAEWSRSHPLTPAMEKRIELEMRGRQPAEVSKTL